MIWMMVIIRYTDWNKQYKVYKKYMKNPATVITVDENGEQTQTTVEAEKINKQSAGKKDKKKDKKKTKKGWRPPSRLGCRAGRRGGYLSCLTGERVML